MSDQPTIDPTDEVVYTGNGQWEPPIPNTAPDEAETVTENAAKLDPPRHHLIGDTLETFRRWQYLPNPLPLYAALGTVAANRLDGDPVWLLLVAPPAYGKSEILQAISELDDAHSAATLTEGALLSGTPAKDKTKGARGGLLKAIGDFGIIVAKDFGSVLSMHRDARAAVLAALREIYDGHWTRHVGVDGGKTLHWSGKVGFLAGVTDAIERHHAVTASMGERFILCRFPNTDPDTQSRQSLRNVGKEAQMRRELGEAVRTLFASRLDHPRPVTDTEQGKLINLAGFTVQARSSVERDPYQSREIVLVPAAEAPGRLVKQLVGLLNGLDAIGVPRPDAWNVINQMAWDSLPTLRRKILAYLYGVDQPQTTTEVATAVAHPTTTTKRTLEDLTAHNVVLRDPQGKGKADLWELSNEAQRRITGIGHLPAQR
jgi:hypothetical protein